MSGLTEPSLAAIRPKLGHWVRRMHERGVTEIPESPWSGDWLAVDLATQMIRQAAGFKHDSIAHELRNLTGTRPWKP